MLNPDFERRRGLSIAAHDFARAMAFGGRRRRLAFEPAVSPRRGARVASTAIRPVVMSITTRVIPDQHPLIGESPKRSAGSRRHTCEGSRRAA